MGWVRCPPVTCRARRLQRIIRRNDGAETSCTERDGWCLPKTGDDLRDAMSLMIRQAIRAQRPGEAPFLPCWLLQGPRTPARGEVAP